MSCGEDCDSMLQNAGGQRRRYTIDDKIKAKKHELALLPHSHNKLKLSNRRMFRMLVKRALYMTRLGQLYQHFIVVLSCVMCLEVVFKTYLAHDDDGFFVQMSFFWEIFSSVLFTFDWALHLYTSDHRMIHLFSFLSIVDLATVVPVWAVLVLQRPPVNYEAINSIGDGFVYLLYGATNLVSLRILRLFPYVNMVEDEVHRLFAKLALSTVAMILFDALLLQYVERREGDSLYFHDWLYFMTTSVATIG